MFLPPPAWLVREGEPLDSFGCHSIPISSHMTFNHQRRLDRALHHLESLKTEIAAWVDECSYRTGSELDADGRYKFVCVELLHAPPTDNISLIIGYCLHNLRAALDNLAFELATAHTGDPLPSKYAGKSEFPIFGRQNPDKFDELLGGVHPCAKAEIERLQPYNRGQKAGHDFLWQLNKLSNIDKHRLPHPTVFATAAFGYIAPMGVEVEPIFSPIKDRAPIARYTAIDETGVEVDLHLTPTFSVGFGHAAPPKLRGVVVPERLRYIHTYITKKVLPPLNPYLTDHGSPPYCRPGDNSQSN